MVDLEVVVPDRFGFSRNADRGVKKRRKRRGVIVGGLLIFTEDDDGAGGEDVIGTSFEGATFAASVRMLNEEWPW